MRLTPTQEQALLYLYQHQDWTGKKAENCLSVLQGLGLYEAIYDEYKTGYIGYLTGPGRKIAVEIKRGIE